MVSMTVTYSKNEYLYTLCVCVCENLFLENVMLPFSANNYSTVFKKEKESQVLIWHSSVAFLLYGFKVV